MKEKNRRFCALFAKNVQDDTNQNVSSSSPHTALVFTRIQFKTWLVASRALKGQTTFIPWALFKI